jgi:eukaryotic-like serine/threonine-protein kinase
MNDKTTDESVNPPNVDLTGQLLGDYLLLKRLGRGGMADVFLAEQQSLKRKIAVKILKPDLARNDRYIRRFKREAQAAAKLVHSNIIQIFEVGIQRGYYFIAQEYVAGRNLKQFLKQNGTLSPILAISVIRQVASALKKANEEGIVHRDIKPENIMITEDGDVKVADFGLARIADESIANELTQLGVTMGTPLYMSPEQIEGRDIDTRADIYSLGVTSFEMLTGRTPFVGDTALALAVKHLNEPAPDILLYRDDLPPALGSIIAKMLSKKADDRFANGGELLRQLALIKIDDQGDAWQTAVNQLTLSSEGIETYKNRMAVTQKLSDILRGNRSSRTRRFWLFAGIAIAATTAIGFSIPIANPPQYILDRASADDLVPRRQNSREQFREAFLHPNEEDYWLAVRNYFPYQQTGSSQDYYWGSCSLIKLGGLYLKRGESEKAAEQFELLTSPENPEGERFHLHGLAGKLILAFHDFRFDQAKENFFLLQNKKSELEEAYRVEFEKIEPLILNMIL